MRTQLITEVSELTEKLAGFMPAPTMWDNLTDAEIRVEISVLRMQLEDNAGGFLEADNEFLDQWQEDQDVFTCEAFDDVF